MHAKTASSAVLSSHFHTLHHPYFSANISSGIVQSFYSREANSCRRLLFHTSAGRYSEKKDVIRVNHKTGEGKSTPLGDSQSIQEESVHQGANFTTETRKSVESSTFTSVDTTTTRHSVTAHRTTSSTTTTSTSKDHHKNTLLSQTSSATVISRTRAESQNHVQKKEYFEKMMLSSRDLLQRTGLPATRLHRFLQRFTLKQQGGPANLVRRLVDRMQVTGDQRRSYEKELAKSVQHTVTTQNNEIIFFHRGDLLFKDLWQRMDEAKECILLETYTLGPDFTGQTTIDKLIAARKRGVQVILMVDAFGSFFGFGKSHFTRVAEAGIIMREFNPPLSWFSPRHMVTRNHRKQCIIDWEYSYVGGMNVEDKYSHLVPSKKLFRDTHCRIKGPFVKQSIVSFLETFEYALHGTVKYEGQTAKQVYDDNMYALEFIRSGLYRKSFPLSEEDPFHLIPLADFDKEVQIDALPSNVYGSTDVDICFASSHPRAGRRILQACLVNHLDLAQDTICICSPYFFPSKPLKRALYRAAARGVKITILTCQKSDVPLMKYAANNLYQNLVIRHGIDIYEYSDHILHAKVSLGLGVNLLM